MRSGLVRKLALTGAVVVAVLLAFRQGWIPPRLTPLPAIVVEHPFPLVVDWQLKELAADQDLCRGLVSSKHVRGDMIPDSMDDKGCGWTNAVSTASISGVHFPAAQMNCGVAGALALWVTNVVQPAAQEIFEQDVISMKQMGVYNCRKIIGSRFWKDRLSEHASANAADVGGFRLRDGTTISIAADWGKPGPKGRFLRKVHSGACQFFRVVLGPEFNAAHHDHFHLDRGLLWRCR